MPRPTTTLILPISADGKLVSRDAIMTEQDPSWRNQPGIAGYLQQFFDFGETDSYTLTTGDVIALSSVNTKVGTPESSDLRLVVLDPGHALTKQGVAYLRQSVQKLIVIDEIHSPVKVMSLLSTHKVKNLTLHSTPMNALWLEYKLVDYLTLIVYPLVVGQSGTPVASIGLTNPQTLKLLETRSFDNNYVCLRYKVNTTK